MGSSASLSSVRRRIDRLDAQLLRLVNRRAAFALLIGRIKRRRKWPVFDAGREAFVLRHVTRANRGPLSARAVERVFQAVLRECRRRERTSKRGKHQSRSIVKKYRVLREHEKVPGTS